jgi:glucuronoarabinoxylan endo-1,4-beta-xylanase
VKKFKGFSLMAALFLSVEAEANVSVYQNLGANWVGTPTIMVANQPSINLNSAESNWGSSAPYSLGQSFTATVSGTLTNIQMYVTGKNTTNVLYLYDMGPAIQYAAAQPSAIVPGSNSVTTVVSGNLLSTNLQIVVTNMSGPQVVELAFSGVDAVQLVGGHEYYFSLVSLNSGSQMYWYRDGGSTDLYPGGAAYRQNSLINGSKTTDFSLAVTLINTSAPPTIYDCVVDWTNLHQRIDGFGASSAWRSTWTPTEADMFFSTNNGTGVSLDGKTNYPFTGVGLSMLRTRIAPGGTTVESNLMQMAQARGALVWSAPWSPQASFKDNNNVNGGNFVSANNQAYANQLAGYVVNMKTTYGVNIYALSVQNEPDVSAGYESCLWTGQQIHDFIPFLANALSASNVASTKIVAAEDEHWQTNYYATALMDPAVATNVSIIACHNYDGSPPNNIPGALPTYSNPSAACWETEVSKLSGNGAFDPGISDAMYWAGRIHLFMTGAQVNAWHYWWLISNNPDNEGLTDTNCIPAKRMYVLGQYSRFVRPGNYRVDLANYNAYAVIASAYKDPIAGNFAIVVANTNATDTNQSFYFTNFTAATITPWITSSNLSLAAQPSVTVSNSAFSYVIPAMSIVTFVGTALTHGAAAPILTPIPDQTVNSGITLLVTNYAIDPSVPPLSLTFALLNGPTNASLTQLNPTNAVFSWTPLQSQAGTTNLITVQVTDNGSPSQSATNNFNVIVNPVVGVIPTVTALGSSTAASTYGTPITFTASVSPSPTNGETVAFMIGGTTLGTGVLNGGVATYTTSGTDLGVAGSPYSVTAVYNGDGYYQNSTATAVSQSVAAAPLTVASGLAVNNKTYDGTASATINSNNIQFLGIVPADVGNISLSTNGYTASFVSANAGSNIPVTIGGLTLSGSAAGNYNLNQSALSGNILPAPVTLQCGSGSLRITNYFTSANNQFEVYNGLNGFNPPLNGALCTNFQCDVRFAPGSATQTNNGGALIFGHLQFGTRTNYNQDYFGGANYGIDIPATNTGWVHISIPISVTADPNLANIYDLLIHIYGPTYATTLTGPSTLWVDNIAFVGPTNRYVVDQFNPSGSGGYSYSGGQIASVWNNWFGAAWVANSWDATNDAIGVAANNKLYDGTTAATITLYDTLVNAALSGVLSADLPNVWLSTNGSVASFASAQSGSNITVTVNGLTLAGSAGGNYVVSPVTLSAGISRLPITASVSANNKVYDGGNVATLNTILTGTVGGDDVTLDTNGYSAAFVSAGVGSNIALTVTGWVLTGTDANNYSLITPLPVGLIADITPALVTVTANDQSKTFSLPNPVLTAAYNGFVNGEDTNALTTLASLMTTADANSSAGVYPITASGAAAQNYVFNYVSGTLTVLAQPILTGLKADATDYVLTFPTLQGQMYQVEYKTNLTDVTWMPLGDPVSGTGGSLSVSNDSSVPPCFFRLQIWQP